MPHLSRSFAQFDRTWAYASVIPSGTGTVNMFPGASDVSFYRPQDTRGLATKVPQAPMKAAGAARVFGTKASKGVGVKRSVARAVAAFPKGGSTGNTVPPAPEGAGTSPAAAAAAAGAPADAVAAVGSTPAGASAAAAANGGAGMVKTPPELKGGFLGLPTWAVWGAVGIVGFVLVRGLVK